MNPEENNKNVYRADSFEDLRRQLKLDEDETDSVSLFDELMNDGKKRDPEAKAAIDSIYKMLEDDEDEKEEPVTVSTSSRKIINEDFSSSKEKNAPSSKETKKARKEEELEKKLSEKEAEFSKKRSAKNLEKAQRKEEKLAAKQRKKNMKLEKKKGVASSSTKAALDEMAGNENAPVISRERSEEDIKINHAGIEEIETALTSADSEDVNNISMYEFDRTADSKDRKGLNKFLYNTFPNKRDSGKEKLRKIISVLSVITIIGCACYFGSLYVQRHKNVTQTNKLQKYIVEPENEEKAQSEWEKVKAEYPDVEFPGGMNVKYARLYALNPEFVAWLSIPNTQINVQVVKAENNEKYLKQDFYGQYSRYGCPFMDFRDNIRNLSMNTIIYGHHMKDGLMFAELSKYLKPEGFENAPVISLSTLYGDYNFKIYGVFITNSTADDDNGYLFNYIFNHLTSDEAFESYIEAVNERRLYDTGVDIKPGDKLLTLSTCTYEFEDARLVVLARMVRAGENPTSHGKVTVNENPRYPAIWYETKKEDNPFEDADRWYPS
ncbi:MAG: class B sortase [Ruminococcaceae bacterium]|jgi:sortase B|nr:class B sortase [Oscillospiraceae bacterium]